MFINHRFSSKNYFSSKGILLILLSCSLLLTPWNGTILLGLRANDILIMLLLPLSFLFFHKEGLFLKVFSWSLFLLFYTFVGLIVSLLESQPLQFYRAIFIYKYFLVFALPLVIFLIINNAKNINVLSKILFLIFLFLSVWVYFYKYAVSVGIIYGVPRVSFPGSSDYLVSDAHLYSSYLAISMLGYLTGLRKILNHSAFFSVMIFCFSLGALLLTGSRNGILIFSFGFFCYIFLSSMLVKSFFNFSKAGLLFCFIFFSFFLLLSLIFGYDFFSYMSEYFGALLDRATNFNFSVDQSSAGRIDKLFVALDQLESLSLLFGVSPFGAKLDWYDGIISLILAHFGFLGVFLFFFLIVYFLRVLVLVADLKSTSGCAAFSLLVSYILVNFITEFALVTRSYLPFISLLLVIVVYSRSADSHIT